MNFSLLKALSPLGGSKLSWSSYWMTREPSNVAVTITGSTTATVTWTDGASDADGYKVYANGVYNQTVAFGVGTANITGLTADTDYTFYVYAYKGAHLSTGDSDTGTTYTAEAQTWFAACPTQFDSAIKEILNTYVKGLITDGLWSKHDLIFYHASPTEDCDLINVVNPGADGDAVGSPIFVANQGITFANGKYVSTNLNPGDGGSHKYVQNSATVWYYSRSDISEGNIDTGANQGGNSMYCYSLSGSNQIIERVNDNANGTGASTDSRGLFIFTRTAAGVRKAYIRGEEKISDTQASTGIANAEIFEGCWNNAGTPGVYCTKQFAMYGIASGFAPVDVTNLNARNDILANAIGFQAGPPPITGDLLLITRGDGSGVATFTLQVSSNITATVGGTARFYTDAAGTLGESTTWNITSGADRTIYMRCPTDFANILFTDKTKITRWPTWLGNANAPSISGSIAGFTALTYLSIGGPNNLSGSVAGLTGLTWLEVIDDNELSGSVAALTSLTHLYVTAANTLSGSLAALTSLTQLVVKGSNTISGSLAALTSLTDILVEGTNTLSGDISAFAANLTRCQITGTNTVTGDISGMNLTTEHALIIRGNNTVSGDIATITNCTLIDIRGNNTVSGSVTNLTSLTSLYISGANTVAGDLGLNNVVDGFTSELYLVPCDMVDYTAGATWENVNVRISPAVGKGYSATEVDNILIDMAASGTMSGKTIILTGSNAARTAASNAAVATLVTAGNTVTTNP